MFFVINFFCFLVTHWLIIWFWKLKATCFSYSFMKKLLSNFLLFQMLQTKNGTNKIPIGYLNPFLFNWILVLFLYGRRNDWVREIKTSTWISDCDALIFKCGRNYRIGLLPTSRECGYLNPVSSCGENWTIPYSYKARDELIWHF